MVIANLGIRSLPIAADWLFLVPGGGPARKAKRTHRRGSRKARPNRSTATGSIPPYDRLPERGLRTGSSFRGVSVGGVFCCAPPGGTLLGCPPGCVPDVPEGAVPEGGVVTGLAVSLAGGSGSGCDPGSELVPRGPSAGAGDP